MNNLRIVKGNTFWTLTEVIAIDSNGSRIEDFNLSACTNISVYLVTKFKRHNASYNVLENNELQVKWDGKLLGVSSYSLEVTGLYNGIDWRFYDSDVLKIVYSNADANIPESSFVSEDFYRIVPSELVILTSIPQIQADWNETDVSSAAFIKNKPEIPSIVDNVYVSDGNLIITFNTTNGEQTITLSLLDIFNPSDYYTKQDVDILMETTYGQVETLLNNSVFYETVYKGVWEEGEYEKDSMVEYRGVLYVALRNTSDCPLNNDGTLNEDWIKGV